MINQEAVKKNVDEIINENENPSILDKKKSLLILD